LRILAFRNHAFGNRLDGSRIGMAVIVVLAAAAAAAAWLPVARRCQTLPCVGGEIYLRKQAGNLCKGQKDTHV
jgi:hypothetical protein